MTPALFQSLLAFVTTAAVLMVLRRPAVRARLVDAPGGRKRHARAVPLIGGIGIFLGFLVGVFPADFALRDYDALFAGMGLLLLVGVVDDIVNVRASAKLLLQIFVAVLMTVWAGVVVEDLGFLFGGDDPVELGEWSRAFTILCVVGLINAVNMLDGVDGLAAGVVAVALAWLTAAGVLSGAGGWPVLSGLLLAAVLGFLVFNLRNPWRRRAACFLGDSGSMMLGYALAWFAVMAASGDEQALPPVAIGWILALPVIDSVVLMLRRCFKGYHPFQADREHLHHLFLRAGLTPGAAVSVIIAGSALLGAVGFLGGAAEVPDAVLAAAIVPVVVAHGLIHMRAWRFARLLRRAVRWLRNHRKNL